MRREVLENEEESTQCADGTLPRVRIGIDARLIRAFGIGSYIRGLLGGLSRLGGPERYVVFVRTESLTLIPDAFETVVADIPPYSIRELLAMRRLVSRAQLDLLHVPHFLVPWAPPVPVVTTLFDAIPLFHPLPNPIATAYIAAMLQRAAGRSARVITISHAAGRQLTEALDCDPAKLRVIPIGVEEMFFRTDVPRREGPPYFLFVGRWERHKNVEVLLGAFDIARQAEPALRVVLAGGRHERFGGHEGVVVPGFVDEEELLALYRNAMAVVMPSLMEGFGLPAAEAMALGTPVITSNDAALREVTGDAALHFDARSAEELAGLMLRVTGDAGLREELGVRGRERARAFTWARCAEATRAVYREVR